MFLDKNRDMLRPDLLDLLQGSKSKVVPELKLLESLQFIATQA